MKTFQLFALFALACAVVAKPEAGNSAAAPATAKRVARSASPSPYYGGDYGYGGYGAGYGYGAAIVAPVVEVVAPVEAYGYGGYGAGYGNYGYGGYGAGYGDYGYGGYGAGYGGYGYGGYGYGGYGYGK